MRLREKMLKCMTRSREMKVGPSVLLTEDTPYFKKLSSISLINIIGNSCPKFLKNIIVGLGLSLTSFHFWALHVCFAV